MSYFIRATGGMLGELFAVSLNDDRAQQLDYSAKLIKFGPDTLWPRSSFLGQAAAAGSFLGELNNAAEVWDWSAFLQNDAAAGQRRDAVAGLTRDSTGAALGGVSLIAIDIATGLEIDATTSDASGNYVVTTPFSGQSLQIVAYKAGTPVFGASNRLTPA